MNIPEHLDTSFCKPHHLARPMLQQTQFPLKLIAGWYFGLLENWRQMLEEDKVKHEQQSRPVAMFCFVGSMVWVHERFQPGTVDPREESQVWNGLQPLTKEKQESVRKKEEEENKHCHYEEWNVFATKIVNVCIIQPHHSVICWVFKRGDVKHSNQCAKYLCVWEEDKCC